MQVLINIFQTLMDEASSRPFIFLLVLILGGWLLFQRTYVTIVIVVLLYFTYYMGDYYGFTS